MFPSGIYAEVNSMNAKKMITDAAFSLFREFPFDTITVQMILNRAEVSRKTFYKYFADKYALMELYYRNEMDRNITENYNGHNWEEIVCRLYDFIKIDRSYFRHVNNTTGQGSFWEFLRDYSFNFYRSVKLHNEDRNALTETERLTIIMLIEAQLALMKLLIEEDISLNRKEFADLMVRPMPNSYKILLHDAEKYNYTPAPAC